MGSLEKLERTPLRVEHAVQTRLTVLLFTDIVGSVDLKMRIGTAAYAQLLTKHDALFRSTIEAFPSAAILKDLGDGFLTQFSVTSDAVIAALRFRQALEYTEWDPEPIHVRIGLHLGEVAELEDDIDGKPKLVGLTADLSARIMGLALPGQILMTRAAFDNARQYVRSVPAMPGEGIDPTAELQWQAHGPYLFKGSDEPMEVFEVGIKNLSPLSAPPSSEKAQRAVRAGEELVYGWRPASGLPVPQRKGWVLERKLGEGGFGEVWLAANKRTMNRRVFKFCFDADRLRSLKRELTLFRLLRDALGDRKDIARLYEVQLDEAPFFLESEFTESGSLLDWSDNLDGIDKVPLSTRIDLLARIARAAAAAHSVGIVHKDIKPGNILIYEDEQGQPLPRLADFGIGMLTDDSKLQDRNITMAGFTEDLDDTASPTTGTRMYSPPETMSGKPFTVLGDVYALGVLLYQMVVGDFKRPLAQGWEREVRDPILREDIAVCVDGNEQQRLGSAQGLAKRLETLTERQHANRRRKAGRIAAFAGSVLIVLLALASAWGVQRSALLKTAVSERDKAKAMNMFLEGIFQSADPRDKAGRGVLVVDVLDVAAAGLEEQFGDNPEIKASLHVTLGRTYKQLDLYQKAEDQLITALDLRLNSLEPPHEELAEALHELAAAKFWLGAYTEAKTLYLDALSQRTVLADRTGRDDIKRAAADTLNHLGATCHRLNQPDEAADFYRRSLAIRRGFLPEGKRDVARTLNNFGTWLIGQGRFAEAEKHFRDAMPIFRELHEGSHADIATCLGNLGRCLSYLKQYDEAQLNLREAISMKREVLGSDSPRLAKSLQDLGELLLSQNDPDGAEPLLREAVDIHRRSLPEHDRRTALTESGLAESLIRLDRLGDAETLLLQSFPILIAGYGANDERTQRTVRLLIDLYLQQGKAGEAEKYREFLADRSSSNE